MAVMVKVQMVGDTLQIEGVKWGEDWRASRTPLRCASATRRAWTFVGSSMTRSK